MDLENRLKNIEERNKKVSLDKCWETSFTRRFSICLITYFFGSIIFIYIIPTPQWYLASLVPVVGYSLSTLGLPWLRKTWEHFQNKTGHTK